MKKTIILFIGVCLICLGVLNENKKENNELYNADVINKEENTLSMMLETEFNSGKYEETTGSSWPAEGYLFNSTLSKCKNGSSLSWDNDKKQVIFEGNTKDDCYVYFDVVISLANYVKQLYTGTQGENNLYLHDNTLENGANDGSYRYAGAEYILTDLGKKDDTTSIFAKKSNDTSSLINYYCNDSKTIYHYCSKSFYFKLKNEDIKYNSFSEVISKAISLGFIKSNQVTNFVCFGYSSNNGECPSDNLYRIIGIFDNNVKLIKYDYAKASLLGTDGGFDKYYSSTSFSNTQWVNIGSNSENEIGSYKWNNDDRNTWSTSLLNTVNLNKHFLNNIGENWSNKIVSHIWQVGGNTTDNIYNVVPSVAYTKEITTPATNTTYESKVGLMYVSDYGYAMLPDLWSYNPGFYGDLSLVSENWMYMGLTEWTITPNTKYDSSTFYIFPTGAIGNTNVFSERVIFSRALRPTFYLNSNVTYVSGSGTKTEPIIIK